MTPREDRYKISYDNSDASVLRFRINDGTEGQAEPVYAETKASILRRRTTMSKLLEEQGLNSIEFQQDVQQGFQQSKVHSVVLKALLNIPLNRLLKFN